MNIVDIHPYNSVLSVLTMDDLQVCRICLIMDVQMYDLRSSPLDAYFECIFGVNPHSHELLTQVCAECAVFINKCYMFREKCIKGIGILQDIYRNNEKITKEHIKCIDRNQYKLASTIKFSNETNSFLYTCSHLEKLQPKSAVDIKENMLEIGHSWINSKIIPDIPDELNDDHNWYSDPDEKPSQIFDIEAEATDTDEASGRHKQKQIEDNDIKGGNKDPEEIRLTDYTNKLNWTKKDNSFEYSDDDNSLYNLHPKELNVKQETIKDRILKIIVDKDKIVNMNSNDKLFLEPRVYVNVDPKEVNLSTIRKSKKETSLVTEVPRPHKKLRNEYKLKETKPKKNRTSVVDIENPKDCNIFNIITLTLEEQKAVVKAREQSELYQKATTKCTICFRVFARGGQALDVHMRKHIPSNQLVCEVCGYRYSTRRGLRNHERTHRQKFVCTLCPATLISRLQAKTHQEWHKGEVLFKCKQCLDVFQHRSTYCNHLRLKHPSPHVCRLCGYSFASEAGLALHHTNIHKYTAAANGALSGPRCDTCDMQFLDQKAFDKHLAQSSKHVKTFITKRSYERGVRTAEVDTPQDRLVRRQNKKSIPYIVDTNWPRKCDHCDDVISSRREKWTHHLREHPKMEYLHTYRMGSICYICGRKFLNSCRLSNHMRDTHERPLACAHCPKAFGTARKLALHMTAHSSEKRYSCALCGAKFKFRQNMISHQRLHTKQREECRLCDKTFATITSRNAHLKHVHYREPQPPRKNKRRPTQRQIF